MAIIPGIPGLKANILVRGEQAEEYAEDDEDEPDTPVTQVTRYIISEESADFAIKYEYDRDFLLPENSIVVHIYVDGSLVEGNVKNARQRQISPKSVFKGLRHQENGVWKCRDLKFGKLITHEDGPVEGTIDDFKQLGTISLRFTRVVEGEPDTTQPKYSQAEIGFETLHEKNLKGQAISNQVELREARTIPTPPRAARLLYPWGTKAFATFNFKHRSRKDLQINGLIPRSPSPVPLEDRDLDDLSPEELRELVRQQRHDRVRIKNELKRERAANDDTDGEDTVEVIQSQRPTKAQKVSIETIDLSED